MGHVFASVTFTNPDDDSKRVEVNALVDTGATFSVLPASVAEQIELEATGRARVRTATGEVEMDESWAFAEVNGRRAPTPVLISSQTEDPLLGVITLEALRLGVDPASGELTEISILLY